MASRLIVITVVTYFSFLFDLMSNFPVFETAYSTLALLEKKSAGDFSMTLVNMSYFNHSLFSVSRDCRARLSENELFCRILISLYRIVGPAIITVNTWLSMLINFTTFL